MYQHCLISSTPWICSAVDITFHKKKVKCKADENVVEMENALANSLILEWQNSSDCPDERLIENDLGRKIR